MEADVAGVGLAEALHGLVNHTFGIIDELLHYGPSRSGNAAAAAGRPAATA